MAASFYDDHVQSQKEKIYALYELRQELENSNGRKISDELRQELEKDKSHALEELEKNKIHANRKKISNRYDSKELKRNTIIYLFISFTLCFFAFTYFFVLK